MHRIYVILAAAFLVAASLSACGSGGNSAIAALPTGSVSLSLTDGPGDYDHVWITVEEAWFHRNASAGPLDAGWHRFPLKTAVTVDLAALSNGAVGNPIWNNISLPAGDYQQIRLRLAGTEDSLETSASDKGLAYNNEIVIGPDQYPLRIPDARHGIMLTGNFRVTASGHLRLAIDFNIDDDVVEADRNGNTEYILKPVLSYFDLDNAGAIVSHITPTADIPASRFVIKAEQVGPDNIHYVMRRLAVPDPQTGRFVLYPLWPGTYDLVLRGLGHKTLIIRNVTVTRGTAPASGATVIPPLAMTAATPDYSVDGTISSPTGAWVEFYQALADGSQYLVRFRHFNPYTGRFLGFPLSGDDLLVGEFDGSVVTGLTSTTPIDGTGAFHAVAKAILYQPSDAQLVTSSTATATFGTLTVNAPAVARSVSGVLNRPSAAAGADLDSGILFAVHGGMVVNAMNIDSLLSLGTPTVAYSMSNLPGGTPGSPLPAALYGLDAIAWSSTVPGTIAGAIPQVVDLRTSNDAFTDLNLQLMGP